MVVGFTTTFATSTYHYKAVTRVRSGRWFSAGTPMTSAYKTGRQDIVESDAKHHSSNTNPSPLI